jgi:hypothetical protein
MWEPPLIFCQADSQSLGPLLDHPLMVGQVVIFPLGEMEGSPGLDDSIRS